MAYGKSISRALFDEYKTKHDNIPVEYIPFVCYFEKALLKQSLLKVPNEGVEGMNNVKQMPHMKNR